MRSNFVDSTGKKFGRLTALKVAGKNEQGNYLWLCRCNCGKEVLAAGTLLRYGSIRSCGCINRDLTKNGFSNTHNMCYTRFYRIWHGLSYRCNNKNSKAYKDYGGRGIKLCNRWHNFENFRDDMYQDYKECSKKLGEKNITLDRIDNNKGYNKSNCHFITLKENCRNRRSNVLIEYKGQKKCITEWAEIYNINEDRFRQRIKILKWPIEMALMTKKGYGNRYVKTKFISSSVKNRKRSSR